MQTITCWVMRTEALLHQIEQSNYPECIAEQIQQILIIDLVNAAPL